MLTSNTSAAVHQPLFPHFSFHLSAFLSFSFTLPSSRSAIRPLVMSTEAETSLTIPQSEAIQISGFTVPLLTL